MRLKKPLTFAPCKRAVWDKGWMMGRIVMRTRELVEALKAHARFTHAQPGGKRLQMRLASLSGINLPGIDLREAILSGADFTDCGLHEASFDGADLYGADFSRADLRQANFCRADIRGAVFRGAAMAGADLTGADLRPGAYADSSLKLVGAQKTSRHQARASRLRLEVGATVFEAADLVGVNFQDTELFRCDMSNANLSEADLSGTRVRKAKFANANLTGVDFSGAQLEDVDLRGALLSGANFSNTQLVDVHLPADVGSLEDDVRDALDQHQLWLGTFGKKGKRADFAKKDLSGMDLRGTNLTGADFTGARLNATLLDDAVMDFAILRHADMCFASLDRARFDGAFMPGAVMRMTSLRDAHFGRTRLYRHNLEKVPGKPWPAHLEGVDFKGADVRHATFDGTALNQTNFVGAKVDAAKFRRCALEISAVDMLRRRGAEVQSPVCA